MSVALNTLDLDALAGHALALHQAGRLDEAAGFYGAVIGADPSHAQALHYFGVLRIQVGDPAGGAALIERALQARPDDVEALGNLATALNALGRHDDVIDHCDRGLRLQPQHLGLHNNRGAALHALGRAEDALASYDHAAALRPDLARSHFNRAAVLFALGRLDEAEPALQTAIALQPALAEAHRNLGRVLRDTGRPGEAVNAYDVAAALRPEDPEVHFGRANALCDLGRAAEALESYDRCLALAPAHVDAWANRMVPLRDLFRPQEALESCERALALDPANAVAHDKRGAALYAFQRLDEALASIDHALALDPQLAQAHLNRAILLNQQRRFDEAMAAFDRALALQPDDAEAHFHQAMCRLARGEDAAGWRQYEWRWKSRQFEEAVRDLPLPLWLGAEDLTGRTILVHAEQGLGDALQFCRYLPLLARRGATVVFEVYPALVRLAQRIEGVAAVIPRGGALPACDVQTPLMSLPLALGVRAHEQAQSYLSPEPADAARWARRLEDIEGFRIGLCWAGGARPDQPIAHAIDLRRSLPLAAFGPVAEVEGVRLFSLQKGPPAAELAGWSGPPIVDLTAELGDFADTAALIDTLDLVIACDTSTAHLAGAMGKPVWILSRFDTCWRWGDGAVDTPWYPTARLFTQTAPGDWGGVIAAVVRALERRSGTTVSW